MKIIIRRDDLLRQIPPGAELPETLVLDGLPFDEKTSPEHEYADVFGVLTDTQWLMFCELADRAGSVVRCRELGKYLPKGGDVFIQNGVAVHVKGIRKALEEWELPYKIETHRGRRDTG